MLVWCTLFTKSSGVAQHATCKVRIKIEHYIVLLKNRFQCLRRIHTIITDDVSPKKIINMAIVFIMLHNILVGSSYPDEWENGWEEDLVKEYIKNEYEEQFAPTDIDADGRCRRTEMLNCIIQCMIGQITYICLSVVIFLFYKLNSNATYVVM